MTYVPEGLTARRRFIARGNSRTSRARACVYAHDSHQRTDDRRRGPDGSLEKPSRFTGDIGGLSSRTRPEIGEKPSIGRTLPPPSLTLPPA